MGDPLEVCITKANENYFILNIRGREAIVCEGFRELCTEIVNHFSNKLLSVEIKEVNSNDY